MAAPGAGGPEASRHPSPASSEPPTQASRLTLEDVEKLDAQSDFRAYTQRDVDPDVRNAAMRKLFHSDPHFNVMDGLDVYIDDYNTPQPLSRAVMRTLLQARTLGLIDDELKEQDLPPADAVVPSEPAPQAIDEEQAVGEAQAIDEAQGVTVPLGAVESSQPSGLQAAGSIPQEAAEVAAVAAGAAGAAGAAVAAGASVAAVAAGASQQAPEPPAPGATGGAVVLPFPAPAGR